MVPAVVLIFNSRLTLNSILENHTNICPKVTKMGSIAGHRIDYNGVGVLRSQRHIPSKTWPKYPRAPTPSPNPLPFHPHCPISLWTQDNNWGISLKLKDRQWIIKNVLIIAKYNLGMSCQESSQLLLLCQHLQIFFFVSLFLQVLQVVQTSAEQNKIINLLLINQSDEDNIILNYLAECMYILLLLLIACIYY